MKFLTLHHTYGRLANILAAVCLLTLASCVDDYEPTLNKGDHNVLVVEGGINSGSQCIFTLSTTIPMDATQEEQYASHHVSTATVSVCGSDGSTRNATSNGIAGQYALHLPTLHNDASYWLEIKWDGRIYQSEPLKPTAAPGIEELKLHYRPDLKQQEILVTTPITDETQYASWDLDECWEIITPYRADAVYEFMDNSVRPLAHFDPITNHGWCTINNRHIVQTTKGEPYYDNRLQHYKILSIDCSDDRLQTRYFIRLRQTAIGQAEYEYKKLRKELADDPNKNMGSLFAPQPSELPSNVHCTSNNDYRAIGYVGVHGESATYEQYFKGGKDAYYYNKRGMPEVLTPADRIGISNLELYNTGFLPLFIDDMTQEAFWIQGWGVDARRWGARLEKPSFWRD